MGRAASKEKKKHSRAAGVIQTLVIAAIFLAGIGMILYPWFSNQWNQLHQSRAIMTYSKEIDSIDTSAYEKLISDAEAYNARLADAALHQGYQIRGADGLSTLSGSDTEANSSDTAEQDGEKSEAEKEYESLLNYDGSGMMGYINIPCIKVQLPIYHGTSDAVLQTSVGHLEGSSLPVGGESSHCILSGHRGLPSAKLFTDLDQVKIGNTFVLTVLNETYTYQVDRIDVIEPTDFDLLQIEEGKDYCTLVTCTPYGINTHRLLVRGVRVPNGTGDSVSADQSANHGEDSNALTDGDTVEAQELSRSEQLRRLGPYLALGAVGFFLLVLLISLITGFVGKKRRRKDPDETQDKDENTEQRSS